MEEEVGRKSEAIRISTGIITGLPYQYQSVTWVVPGHLGAY